MLITDNWNWTLVIWIYRLVQWHFSVYSFRFFQFSIFYHNNNNNISTYKAHSISNAEYEAIYTGQKEEVELSDTTCCWTLEKIARKLCSCKETAVTHVFWKIAHSTGNSGSTKIVDFGTSWGRICNFLFMSLTFAGQVLEVMKRRRLMCYSSLSTIQSIQSLW